MPWIKTRLFVRCLLTLSAAVFSAAAHAAGTTSTLYFTTANRFNVRLPAGTTTIISSSQQFNPNNGEAAIAVSGGTIRVAAASDYQGFVQGGTYDRNFNPIGSAYPASVGFGVFDGTTDGFHNYGVNTFTGAILEYDLNWGAASQLFTLGITQPAGRPLAITYDPYNSSLWISYYTNGLVQDYTLDGKLLSSFDTGFRQGNCLAFDPADRTLWLMQQPTSGIIDQFSTSGIHLQTVSFGAGLTYVGAEFEISPIPEPTAFALFCLGGLAWLMASRFDRRISRSS